jgi:hypothetical protein
LLNFLSVGLSFCDLCHAISNGAEKFEVTHWDHRFTVDLQLLHT